MEIKRNIYSKIKKHLREKEITLITGPRQCGKTKIMKSLAEELKDSPYVFLNLDVENEFRILSSQKSLLQYLKLTLGTSKRGYVFIDEIQRKENAGLFLKGLYDLNTNYKFVLSGSGSVELKEKVSEGLAGRKKTFKINTISFSEFVNYKTGYKYEKDFTEYLESNFLEESFLQEYMRFGGYPKLVLKETKDEKTDVIESIYESFIDKDIKELLRVQDTAAISDLLSLLSIKIGDTVNYTKLSSKANISFKTAKKYLYYLEKTFILDTVRPFFNNPETEMVKMPSFYYTDLGMRNYVYNGMSHYDSIISGPMLFQNFVYLLLKEKSVDVVNYWRTKDGGEVDFVAKKGTKYTPIEVMYKNLKKPTVTKSMISFIKNYNPDKFIVVNLSLRHTVERGKTKIMFIKYSDLIGLEV